MSAFILISISSLWLDIYHAPLVRLS
jgi:hypothetical protein